MNIPKDFLNPREIMDFLYLSLSFYDYITHSDTQAFEKYFLMVSQVYALSLLWTPCWQIIFGPS